MEDRDMFAERTGISKSTIANYERGDRVPDASMLLLYRDAWGVDLNWLVTGEGDRMFLSPDNPLPEPVQQFLDRRSNRRRGGQSLKVARTEVDRAAERILAGHEPNFAYLSYYDEVRASAGPGAIPASESVSGVIAFDQRFLREKGAAPEHCTVITARGDSMAPTIPDGSLLVVDHSQKHIANGCLMIIGLGDDLLVKRIRRRLDGLIDLVSDNPVYAPETIGSEMLQQLRVVGRVVYFCRAP